jgi:putative endonuclease
MSSHTFVYILRCADGSLYTGYTVDLVRRLKQHSSGNGGKYTRSRAPVELVYFKTFKTRSEAMEEEASIKRLPRAKKLVLIAKARIKGPSPRKRKPPSRDRR